MFQEEKHCSVIFFYHYACFFEKLNSNPHSFRLKIRFKSIPVQIDLDSFGLNIWIGCVRIYSDWIGLIFKLLSTNEFENFFGIASHWLGHRFRNDSGWFGLVRNQFLFGTFTGYKLEKFRTINIFSIIFWF